MSHSMLFVAATTLLLLAGAAPATPEVVFALPGPTGSGSSVWMYSAATLSPMGSFAAAQGAFAVRAHPLWARYFILSQESRSGLTVVEGAGLTVASRMDLPGVPRAMEISPDGRRLVVLASQCRIFDVSTGLVDVTPAPPPDVGSDPSAVAISHDSRTAFVLSGPSRRLTVVNLQTGQVEGSLSFAAPPDALSPSPGGLLYVAASNRIYEVGPSLSIRAEIPVAVPVTQLAITPDGQKMLALDPGRLGASRLFLIDLSTRAILATASWGTELLTELHIASNDLAYGLSATSGRVYAVRIRGDRLEVSEATFSGVPAPGVFTDARALAVSGEIPAARLLFVLTASRLFSVDLAAGAVTRETALTEAPGGASLVTLPSTAAPASVWKFNDSQRVGVGQRSLPLVIRVLDSRGRPVRGAAVQFSPVAAGAVVEEAMAETNAGGFAQAVLRAPSVPGPVTVNVLVAGGALSTSFSVAVEVPGVSALEMLSGNGQMAFENTPVAHPLRVRVLNPDGEPLGGAEVVFSLTSGPGSLMAGPDGELAHGSPGGSQVSMRTNAQGIASVRFFAGAVGQLASYATSTIVASFQSASVQFVAISLMSQLPLGYPAPPPAVNLLAPPLEDRTVRGRVGEVVAGALRVRAVIQAGPQAGQPLPNVGISVLTALDPASGPTIACAGPGNTALSGLDGIAACNAVIGGRPGESIFTLDVGGLLGFTNIRLRAEPAEPAAVVILQGDAQSGNPGETLPLPLRARVNDAAGNPLVGIPVVWEITPPGSATLIGASVSSDIGGQISATVRLGNIVGPVRIRVRAGTAVGTFNLTVNAPISQILKVSGDNQSAVVNTAFGAPLVVEARNAQGNPVPGISVTFAVTSGSATVGSPSATTNALGRASTTVTAGATPGAVVITATAGSLSVTFNLTVSPPGPVVSLAGIRNAISGDLGVTPGGIIAIYGDRIAPGIQGSVVGPNNLIGPLPLQLAGVEVFFGTTRAPIYSVNNVGGQQWVVVQAPWELAAPGTVSVTIRVSGGETVVSDVPVKTYQPGIFETLDEQGRRFAVLLHPDGSYVTRDNPARRGTRIRGFFGGLGPTNPPTGTNRAGLPNQNVTANVVIGVNDEGVPVFSARLLEGVVGVYVVEFEVPATTAPGPERPLVAAILPVGGAPPVYSNVSQIPIQ